MAIKLVYLQESWKVPKIILEQPTTILYDLYQRYRNYNLESIFDPLCFYKFYGNTDTNLCIVYGCCGTAMTVLGSFFRHCIAHKA